MRLHELTLPVVVQRVRGLEVGGLVVPVGEVSRKSHAGAVGYERIERRLHGPHIVPVGPFDLADLRGVDVEVENAAGLGREGRGHARHTVVEAGTHRDQEIAVVHGVVGVCGPVHAQHVER